MADFVCLQYTTDQQNGSENTSSFRRSLNSNLFGRRSMNSRSNNNSGIETQQESVYIRIVPHIDNPSRSLVFSIIERDLEAGHVIRVGRFTDRIATQNHISFKSKVVSRTHCEIWLNNDGKVKK
jgi:pSer/pThr/pTyr-binding forkhead associated (FHA) protein